MSAKKQAQTMQQGKPSAERHAPPSLPQAQGRWGVSFALAVLMHALLFIGLFFVFQWNRESEEVVYAELWAPSQLPQGAPVTAAPVEQKPEQEQEQEQEPQPQPEEKAPQEPPEEEQTPPPEPQAPQEQAAPPPSEQVQEREQAQPDEEAIRLAEEKQREEEKRLEEQRRLEEQQRLEEQRKLEEQRLEEERKLEEQKRLEEQQRLEEQKRLEAEQKAREERRRAQAKALAQRLQQEQMKQLEASSKDNVAGVMASGGRISAQYTARIIGCIRPNIIFTVPPNTHRGQYIARYQVSLAPDGQQKGAPKQLKSSGLPAFDLAVERAIELCNPFPLPPSGRAYDTIQLTFDPVDSNNR